MALGIRNNSRHRRIMTNNSRHRRIMANNSRIIIPNNRAIIILSDRVIITRVIAAEATIHILPRAVLSDSVSYASVLGDSNLLNSIIYHQKVE
jgi:hypothetical protein